MKKDIIEIAQNRKARFNYEILEVFEAGLVLKGTEVKSLRQKMGTIGDAYARIRDGEAWIVGMNISLYDRGNIFNHEPLRERKLLLHKSEIRRLTGKLREKGYTLVPLRLYIKEGKVKVELALARGKALHDKRQTIQKRDADRDMQREIKRYT